MLVLAGQKEEEFILFDSAAPEHIIARVKVCGIAANKVRLGFVADTNVKIDRKVVYNSRMQDLEECKLMMEAARDRIEKVYGSITSIHATSIDAVKQVITCGLSPEFTPSSEFETEVRRLAAPFSVEFERSPLAALA